MVIEARFVRIKQLKNRILYKAFGNGLLQNFYVGEKEEYGLNEHRSCKKSKL